MVEVEMGVDDNVHLLRSNSRDASEAGSCSWFS